MVFKMELTYSQTENILNFKYFNGSTIGYFPENQVLIKISDINLVIKVFFPMK